MFNFNIFHEVYTGAPQADSDADLTIITNLDTRTANERMVGHMTARDGTVFHGGFNISQDVSLDVNDPTIEFNSTISAQPDGLLGGVPKFVADVLVITNKEFEG